MYGKMEKLLVVLFSLLVVAIGIDVEQPTPFKSSFYPTSHTKDYVFSAIPLPQKPYCPLDIAELRNAIYILYEVNRPEGFNLRRDVYIRIAVFVRRLKRNNPLFSNVRLVLMPWPRLLHWRSQFIMQTNLPWSDFFDVESMRRFVPVVTYDEFLEQISQLGLLEFPKVPVNNAFQLMHHKVWLDDMSHYVEKYEYDLDNCNRKYHVHGDYLMQQPLLVDKNFTCVRMLGGMSILGRILRHSLRDQPQNDVKIFAILNAEIALHDDWAGREYWMARRSMRFASELTDIAAKYRQQFNSTDAYDKVQRPVLWEHERPYRLAEGGNYLAVHLRRGDFVNGRETTTPTLRSVAIQIQRKMNETGLKQLFIATDSSAADMSELQIYLMHIKPHYFSAPTQEDFFRMKDAGAAIVEQIICSHAQYFIGSFDSTFTYRIQEEREILGFRENSTFNTLCKNENLENCSKNSIWKIVY